MYSMVCVHNPPGTRDLPGTCRKVEAASKVVVEAVGVHVVDAGCILPLLLRHTIQAELALRPFEWVFLFLVCLTCCWWMQGCEVGLNEESRLEPTNPYAAAKVGKVA